MDISGQSADINLRTDANNLVTTAFTTHLPEQKETIHMIQMLRKESCSGAIKDLAHVVSVDCLSDALTKFSAKAEPLVKACRSGILPNADRHPAFRELMKHKAYVASWLCNNYPKPRDVITFFGEKMTKNIACYLWSLSKASSYFIC